LIFTKKPFIPNEINDFLHNTKIVLMKQDESKKRFPVKNRNGKFPRLTW